MSIHNKAKLERGKFLSEQGNPTEILIYSKSQRFAINLNLQKAHQRYKEEYIAIIAGFLECRVQELSTMDLELFEALHIFYIREFFADNEEARLKAFASMIGEKEFIPEPASV